MGNNQELVRQFHVEAGLPAPFSPRLLDPMAMHLRANLIKEELAEVQFANAGDDAHDPDLTKVAKELTDLLYVVYGTFVEFGLEAEPLMEIVHRSNMSKAPFTRLPGSNKISKGKNYIAPSVEEIMAAVYHPESAI